MKIPLLIMSICVIIGALNAQIEIHIEDAGPDIAGTIYEINADELTPVPIITPNLFVTNNTGIDQQFQITRVKQSVPTAWDDFIYWPTAGYPASGDVYTTPSSTGNPAPTILDGTNLTPEGHHAVLFPIIFPDGNNAVAMYMYYITDSIGNYLDSVGVRINFVLNLEEKTESKMSVYPNPTNAHIQINSEELQSGKLSIIDLLGNTVWKENMITSPKTVDLSSLRNGVYFVRLESENFKITTRKIVVKH